MANPMDNNPVNIHLHPPGYTGDPTIISVVTPTPTDNHLERVQRLINAFAQSSHILPNHPLDHDRNHPAS